LFVLVRCNSRCVTRGREEKMRTSVSKNESRTTGDQGIVYLAVCQNPGCGFNFDLRITPENAKLSQRFDAMSALQRHVTNSNPRAHQRKALRRQAIVPPDGGWASAARQRQCVRHRVHSAHPCDGYPRSPSRRALAVGKRTRRAADRLDPARMP
jgi:hypothetical protein